MQDPRSVLITGATGGIGAALAAAYARPGRKLFLQGRREERLRELARECERRGAEVAAKPLDLLHMPALLAWLEAIAPHVDLAIVNAGVTSNVRAGEGWAEIDQLLQVNVRAALATAALLAEAMRQRRRGQIALMSSIAGYFGLPLTPAYSASKAALKTYGEALRGALADDGVEVNVVMPGFVRTPLVDKQIPEQAKELGITEEEVIKNVMLKDTVDGEFTTVADVAEATLFFAAFPTNALTGQSLIVSHGWFME